MRLRETDRTPHGGYRSHSAVAVMLAVVLGGFVTVGTSQRALATTTHSWNGYAGNNFVYMSKGLTDLTRPYLIPTLFNSSDQETNSVGIHNAINVSSGGSQYATQGQVFDEYYKSDTAELIVDVPIVAAGAGAVQSPGLNGCAVYYQYLSLTLSNVPISTPTATAGLYTPYNSGDNVTG